MFIPAHQTIELTPQQVTNQVKDQLTILESRIKLFYLSHEDGNLMMETLVEVLI